jgi:hypothetical protein
MTPILADMVWPGIMIMERYYTWWAILLGLFVEYFALRLIANSTWKKAAIAVVVVNTASALIGYFLTPWLTLGWEFILSYTVYQVIHLGTFNIFGWLSTIIIMGGITTIPEYLLLKYAFRIQFNKKKPWLWWWLANCVSVLIAFLSLIIWPAKF